MQRLHVVNKQRQPLAEIIWTPPDQITVDIHDKTVTNDLQAFLETARMNGLPLRTGEQVQKEGRTLFTEKKITVKADDARFLSALSDALRRTSLAGQRAFGIIQKTPKEVTK